MSDKIDSYPVLRVTQLDTNELEESLLLTIKHSINDDFFKYIQFKFIQQYRLEIFAALKFLLWYHTFGKKGQTVGQALFDWSYAFGNDNGASRRTVLLKKIAHACIYCLDEWFEQKFLAFLKRFIMFVLAKNQQDNQEQIGRSILDMRLNQLFEGLIQAYKGLSFFNYITFLFNGKYLSLWERLLRLRPVYSRPQFMPVSSGGATEASIREELWQTYFTLFRLASSVFDMRKVCNKYLKNAVGKRSTSVDDHPGLNKCGLCFKQPVMAHRGRAGCEHVFCYMCIRQEVADGGGKDYVCRICSRSVGDIELYVRA